jgi:sec-independent protein translocase protein TatA
MGEFSITHWLIILAILLLFFGPSKLPGLGASLGKAIRGFKSGLNEADPNEKAAQSRPEQIEPADHAQASSETTKSKEPHGKA